jgi:hypothetical protein
VEEQRAWPLRPQWCERVTRFYSVILCMACCERVKCEHSLTCKRWQRRQSPSIAFCDSWCCVASCMHPSCAGLLAQWCWSPTWLFRQVWGTQYFASNTSWDTIFHLTQLISHSQQLQFFPYLFSGRTDRTRLGKSKRTGSNSMEGPPRTLIHLLLLLLCIASKCLGGSPIHSLGCSLRWLL